jgi:HAD superfamily hydrolase (TIGR01509 family)
MFLENIELGIFDHSGVLSDDRKPVYEANMILFDRNSIPRISSGTWLAATKASAGDLLKSFGVDLPKEEIDAQYEKVYNEIVTRNENPIRPEMYEGVPDVLRALRDEKGIKLAIVSSHPRKNLVRELEEYGILDLFDEVSGDPMGKTERLRKVCAGFGVSPREAFFVEDTIYGLRSGHAAGVNCFGITTGYHFREMLDGEETAVKVIDSLDELLSFV